MPRNNFDLDIDIESERCAVGGERPACDLWAVAKAVPMLFCWFCESPCGLHERRMDVVVHELCDAHHMIFFKAGRGRKQEYLR